MGGKWMSNKKLREEAIMPGNAKWETCTTRERALYKREQEVRSDFNRDYNRILHCNAYRRLKHKTQVFFNTQNDHICTRMEHVQHVASISYSIADYLGLNTELTLAVATGHDIGHTPFGHEGERVLSKLKRDVLKEPDGFWHEKNSLYFVDNIELLEGIDGCKYNLDLTYGVRDGIILHCGEVDEEVLKPREEIVDLSQLRGDKRPAPYTWEGCVVKIADKIAYLGRDIEDALSLGILSQGQIKELVSITRGCVEEKNIHYINNTVLINRFITSICKNSNLEKGICFSKQDFEMIKAIKSFNYQFIYSHPRLSYFKKYVELMMTSIFEELVKLADEKDKLGEVKYLEKDYPLLGRYFYEWLITYSYNDDKDLLKQAGKQLICNKKLYHLDNPKEYKQAIIDFIAGMSDEFVHRIFQEFTVF